MGYYDVVKGTPGGTVKKPRPKPKPRKYRRHEKI
jgi:hypothetical protein